MLVLELREVEVYHFSLALAKCVNKPEMREVFEDLPKEELEHKAKLELEAMKTGEMVAVALKPGWPVSEYVMADDSQLDVDYKDMLLWGMEKEEVSSSTNDTKICILHSSRPKSDPYRGRRTYPLSRG